MSVLYRSDPVRGKIWAEAFAAETLDLTFHLWPNLCDLTSVEYLIASEPALAKSLTRESESPVLAVHWRQSFESGADSRSDPGDPHERAGHRERYARIPHPAVLALHRDLPEYLRIQQSAAWRTLAPLSPPPRGESES